MQGSQVLTFDVKFSGVFSAAAHVTRREGFVGLYRGNGAQMVRIFPYAAVQFLSYEQYKKVEKMCGLLLAAGAQSTPRM